MTPIKMNKKGSMLIRNVMFTVLIFGTLLALMTIFVTQMATEYENTSLQNEYSRIQGNSSFLNNLIATESSDLDDQLQANKDGTLGLLVTGALGIGSFLLSILLLPFTIGGYIGFLTDQLGIPFVVGTIIKGVITTVLYIVIIFGIFTALSRGGKV